MVWFCHAFESVYHIRSSFGWGHHAPNTQMKPQGDGVLKRGETNSDGRVYCKRFATKFARSRPLKGTGGRANTLTYSTSRTKAVRNLTEVLL